MFSLERVSLGVVSESTDSSGDASCKRGSSRASVTEFSEADSNDSDTRGSLEIASVVDSVGALSGEISAGVSGGCDSCEGSEGIASWIDSGENSLVGSGMGSG